MSSFVKGMILQEVFFSDDTGYGVYRLEVQEASDKSISDEVTIVGHFLRPVAGETYACEGEWREHPRFGAQYVVSKINKELPKTEQAIIKYLSSGLFHGIGKKTAEKIVAGLGGDALHIIASNPSALAEIPGVSHTQANTIAESLGEHQALEEAMVLLYEYGLGAALALRVIQRFKQETVKVIKENPYLLIDEIEGIGFFKADEIAKAQGFSPHAPERYEAAILYSLQEASNEGHVYLARNELHTSSKELLTELDESIFEDALGNLLKKKKVMMEEDRVYLVTLFYAEFNMALKCKVMLHETVEKTFPAPELFQAIGELEEEFEVHYADSQREAMIKALTSPLMILTGGPGTGKTTVIRGLCHLFARLHELNLDGDGKNGELPIRLVAPTGRAAKRMTETTGIPAMTIHRLLGYRGGFFEHDADNPITGSLLVVDETSMLDIWLANQLFRAIPPTMQVVLVGDADQLPSVGPGLVLEHLLEVPQIPRVQLTDIFRQAEDSSIIQLAHAIRKGELPDDLLTPLADRRFFSCQAEQSMSVIEQTYENAIKKGYTLFDIQVLAPMYKGQVGVNRINEKIQQIINPKRVGVKEVAWGDTIFRFGDKVLQLSNHQDHPVYNGDMGLISAMDESAKQDDPVLWVQFDRQEVPYKRNQLGQLSLGYACSVHKAQGSEFPIVIFPFLPSYHRMLERNLIYTGITRSKSYLILCGEVESMRKGVKATGEARNTVLKDLILDEW
ncbi:SF1B family DNA helicase RecD2 [Shimazuella kribbensis]|uniref:SF1B family DNA helicase RecD2 n=1 Tax=Shimazuella kribbensis TaxID=139808 RepID=UPI00041BA4C4|nr:ATP-dependent RecD-like DNA helicase [Shimazuella kribbensis]